MSEKGTFPNTGEPIDLFPIKKTPYWSNPLWGFVSALVDAAEKSDKGISVTIKVSKHTIYCHIDETDDNEGVKE